MFKLKSAATVVNLSAVNEAQISSILYKKKELSLKFLGYIRQKPLETNLPFKFGCRNFGVKTQKVGAKLWNT